MPQVFEQKLTDRLERAMLLSLSMLTLGRAQFEQQLTDFITEVLECNHATGASVSVVSNGATVYSQGFGTKDSAEDAEDVRVSLIIVHHFLIGHR